MDHHRLCTTGLSNDMLTLWLKAKDGLPCDEARELIDKVSELELEIAAGEEERSKMYTQEECDEAASAQDGYSDGEKAGSDAGYRRACDEWAVALDRLINPTWGKKPTKERLIIELTTFIRQMRADDGSN